jgi:orotidine-5'-phosphate decarboxylase
MASKNEAELIVALDVGDIEEAGTLVGRLSGHVKWFKVGSKLFTREGPSVCRMVKDAGCKLFLDLKFHDIPNTVHGAVLSALACDADMLTLHASGGVEMLRAAVRARMDLDKPEARLVAVTLLTHLDGESFSDLFPGTPPGEEMVIRLAGKAKEAGMDGVVASAREVAVIKANLGADFKVVTPGIRLGDENGDDQKRVATPERAVRDGADYLVVGRPIIGACDPVAACEQFLARMRI